MINVLICDDQDMVCEGLKAILSAEADIRVVGIARDGAEVLDRVAACNPDLVLMDLKMPLMNGIQATRLIRRQYPRIKISVL